MKTYRISKIEKNQKEVTVELTEAQFLLLESFIADNEDLMSDKVTADKFSLDEPLQECFADLHSKVTEVL
jgi:hypothetical protein